MSLNNEVLLCKARISEREKSREEMEMRADSYTRMIRDIIDPFSGDFVNMDLTRAELLIKDFRALQEERKKLDDEIRKLRRELNG
ncbi:MAG: hypothetical protein HGA78_01215 [Nitrospirales bacterium]|nr:hypothetical protein [Nitrospirales bacterium]